MLVSIRDASPREIAEIVQELRQQGRQVMNLTQMPGSRLLIMETDGERIAYCGYNERAFPSHPEIFSQTVLPAFRGTHLGNILIVIIIRRLAANGAHAAFSRMETHESGDNPLLDHRKRYDFCTPVTPAELPETWVGLCRRCNIFGTSCSTQSYLRLDTRLLIQQTEKMFGIHSLHDRLLFVIKGQTITVDLRSERPTSFAEDPHEQKLTALAHGRQRPSS